MELQLGPRRKPSRVKALLQKEEEMRSWLRSQQRVHGMNAPRLAASLGLAPAEPEPPPVAISVAVGTEANRK